MTATQSVPQDDVQQLERLVGAVKRLRAQVAQRIVGQEDVVDGILTAVLAGGHALLIGVPGLAKTLMVQTVAEALELSFNRVQFTPDLMPSDITGTEIIEEDLTTGRRAFRFVHGPIFANVVLADEINRTPPKTQAALLEAMQEGAVTYGGTTYPLERPFFVLATQNPIEQTGTYPLPEAQLDRFLLYIRVGYPTIQDERDVLARTTGLETAPVRQVARAEDILAAQRLVREVAIGEPLLDYVTRLVRASRPDGTEVGYVREWVRWGAGPRAGQAMILTAKARALLAGRFAVTPEDLRSVAAPVLRHRVLVNFRAEGEGLTADQVTRVLLEQVPPPRSPLS
jgi:MoxR-like ATPase